MDVRPRFRYRNLWLLLLLSSTLVSSSGCASVLATAVWLVKGPNVPAEFKGLGENRVAVVCQPLSSLAFQNSDVAKDIAKQTNLLLRKNVRKMQAVDPRDVDEWIDENPWEEYIEIGNAVESDLIVGIDLESFSIYQGQTVYQGRANVTIKVVDCQNGETVFEKRLPEVIYPPNSLRSTSDQQESDFRREFVGVLSDTIARHFYPHDPHAYFALDAASIK